MATAQPLYHAPVFEPTVDELATLKHLELGQSMGMPEALKQHPLRVGLSMQVTVDTRSGPAGAAGVATTAAQ